MRDQLRNRPLVLLVLAYALGLGLPREPLLLALVPLFAAFVPSWRGAGGLALAMGLGVLLSPAPPPPPLKAATEAAGVGRIASVPEEVATGKRFLLETSVGTAMTVAAPPLEPIFGERIEFSGTIRPPREGQDDWLRQNRAVGTMKLSTYRRVGEAAWWSIAAAQARSSYLRFVERALLPGLASLLAGVTVNSDRKIPEVLREDLRKTGTIHIVSASGFHVFVIATVVSGLMAAFGASRIVQIVGLAVVLGFFSVVAGLEPPIIRASVMAILLHLAFFVRREPDALCALAFAFGGYLLLFPAALDDLGLRLSAAAVAGLAIGYRRVPRADTWTRAVRYRTVQALRMSACATLAISPLIALTFGTVSPIAIVANPLIALAVSVVMPLGLACFALSHLFPALAAWLVAALAKPLLGWLVLVAEGGAKVPFGHVEVPAFTPWLLVPIYLLLLLLWRWRPVDP